MLERRELDEPFNLKLYSTDQSAQYILPRPSPRFSTGVSAVTVELQGLVHMKLTSKGFHCITDLLLPRTNNLILFMSIQPARNLLGKFVRR